MNKTKKRLLKFSNKESGYIFFKKKGNLNIVKNLQKYDVFLRKHVLMKIKNK
jgi:hypothetical protein